MEPFVVGTEMTCGSSPTREERREGEMVELMDVSLTCWLPCGGVHGPRHVAPMTFFANTHENVTLTSLTKFLCKRELRSILLLPRSKLLSKP